MSTKRGRRNGKWHKEKSNRRLQEKRDALRSQSRKAEYVPLDKPVFCGWDVTMVVEGERSDAKGLEYVAKVMGWSNDFYVGDVNRLRSIRRYGRTYQAYVKLRGEYYGYNNFIWPKDYFQLPYAIKCYFRPTDHKYGIVYILNWNFPFYALSLKIKKSFYYYKKVYDTEAQSEYYKLNSNLYLVDQKSWGRGYQRDDFRDSIKSAWKCAMREITSKQFEEEDLLDYKYPKCWDKKSFGWN